MATASSAVASEIEIFRHHAQTTQRIVHINVEGITQEESLIQPQPAGNCLNWVVGHLICIYDRILPMLGQQPVMGDALKRYDRGASPLQNPAEALPLSELLVAWDKACERVNAGLAALTQEQLDRPAPFSPTNNPNETTRTLLSLICFHQAYRTGQLGVLRRIAGKKGAIA